MPDLFDPLRDLDDLSSHPLPAAEVRRRGDRMRRRRHALQTLGGAAAVVLVASGVAFTANLFDDAGPTPAAAPAPKDGWRTEIPTHYPLDRGYPMEDPPETTQLGPSQKFAPLTDQHIAPCGTAAYPSARPVDSVGTVFTVPDEQYARELTVYADSTTASAVASHLVDAWAACPVEEVPDPPFEVSTSVSQDNLGDESWTVVRGANGAPGTQVYNVARVGNAVLISTASTAALLENAGRLVDDQQSQVSPLVADMCVFALVPCTDVDRPDREPMIPTVEESMLLTTDQVTSATGLVGWEELGQREDPTIDCQPDWLRNLGADKGGFREWALDGSETATAVLQFADPRQARQAFDQVHGWLDACDPRIPGTRDLSPVTDTSETSVGDFSALTRLFSAPTGDGGQRLDQQGAALVGTRVVFLAMSPDPSTGTEEESLLDGWLEAMTDAVAAAAPRFSDGGQIPDGFPLLGGWPADEAESPNPSQTAFDFTACGDTFEDPSYVDQATAGWFSDELTGHDRRLTAYSTPDAAKAFVQSLTDFYRACPTEDKDVTSHYEVRRTSAGDESWAVIETFTFQGQPSTGITLFHVVRVGSAVLVDTVSGEGGAGPDGERQISRALTSLTDASPEVVAAMCLFSSTGC